jgi:hypothetical protein
MIRHSFYVTSQGRRRRFRCKECGRTFCSIYGTPCYRLHKSRSLFTEYLIGQMTLLMTYYSFLRPHRALKFGGTLRTPAMQAGLVKKCLSFREVFTSPAVFFSYVLIVVFLSQRSNELRQRGGCNRNSTTLA